MKRLGVAAAVVDGALLSGDVGIESGVVAAVGLPPGPRGLAVPGLVDMQVNGYAGVDFLTAGGDDWLDAGRALARAGVTAYAANLITAAESMTRAALAVAAEVRAATAPDRQRGAAPGAAQLVGAHLEGPFLSPARAGTHPAEHLREPDERLMDRLLAAGPVVAVTLAPELPGALRLIARLRERGVLISLGHSDASAEQAHGGFDAGARAVTHIFNAMSSPTARAAGLAGVALVRDDVAVQVICDGVHLGPETTRLVVAAAADRLVLVTDALAPAGCDHSGPYRLGDVEISVEEGVARRADGTLAGSVLDLAGGLRRAVAAGASVEHAVTAATSRPADLLGRPDLGRLSPGAGADVVVLDDALIVGEVYLAGVPVD